MTLYLLIKRQPRIVFEGSGLFVGKDLADAEKNVVEEVFGTGFPNTPRELLERYNLEVVEFDEDWEKKFDTFGLEYPECPDPSLAVTKWDSARGRDRSS